MKYAIALFAGFLLGAALLLAGFYYNPFVGRPSLSPLAVENTNVLNLSYSSVSSKAILLTNSGASRTSTYPTGVAELWEPAVKATQLRVVELKDGRGRPAGIGIKISTPSEKTRLYRYSVLVDSVWHVYMPGIGTLGIYEQENYWSYLRDIVVPAIRAASDSWKGTWSRNMTIGPRAIGTAEVFGLAGMFDGMQSEAVESLNARAYSTLQGPVLMNATLDILMPSEELADIN